MRLRRGRDGASQVGEQGGLPPHPLAMEGDAADAHVASERGAVGIVLIELP
ncbi:hypothetical protein [Streptomyces sp. NPDC001089]